VTRSEVRGRAFFAEYAETLGLTTQHVITVVRSPGLQHEAVYYSLEDFDGMPDDAEVLALARRTPVWLAFVHRDSAGVLRVQSQTQLDDTVATLSARLAANEAGE
jgi:hypothetical protein